jgi:uncharacterized protein (TIGR03083 family)
VTATDSIETVLSALRSSHARLAGTAGPLTADEVTARSYCGEWSIAQVLSHLGSGAEIFDMVLDAGLRGGPAPGMEQFQQVWDRWNAKSPQDQARDAVAADAAFLDRLGELSPAQRTQWRMSMFGGEQTLGDMARMRLGEHAVHTWDIAVALDGKATVAGDAAGLILEILPGLAARAGKPAGQDLHVHVTTHDPGRSFQLDAGPDSVSLSPAGPEHTGGVAGLRLPAEALVRLVYGRLDPEHTPPVETDHVGLGTLRRIFPGF